MNEQNVRKLAALFKSQVQGGGQYVQLSCPLAPWTHMKGRDVHPSASISISAQGMSKFQCWTCKEHLPLIGLIMMIRRLMRESGQNPLNYDMKALVSMLSHENQEEELELDLPPFEQAYKATKTFFPFSERWLATFPKGWWHPYLKQRGVAQTIAAQMDVRFDTSEKRLCFPIRDRKGRLAGLHGRNLDPNALIRYYSYEYQGHRNQTVLLGEQHMDEQSPLVLVEGPFDMAKVLEVYGNVVAFNGSVGIPRLKRIANAIAVITMFDYGTGGNKNREAVDKFYAKRAASVQHVMLEESDGDPGEMTAERIAEMLEAV